jgi:redox-sensing transcriptional repressor
MTDSDDIPRRTIERLPLYKKTMETLSMAGRTHVSSNEIAQLLQLTDAQIRKDLSYFGKFGVRGKGYDIESLRDKISEILGTEQSFPCVLIGAGNIGQALLSYGGFEERNFEIRAAFDVDPDTVGQSVDGVPVKHMDDLESFLQSNTINLAILAVPSDTAQSVIDRLVECDVKGILNFAPVVPETPDDVIVENVDLSTNLEVLSYFLNNPAE